MSEREASTKAPATPDASSPPVRVIVSSQDAEGVTAQEMDIAFLRRLEQHTVESIKDKVKRGRSVQGYTGPELELQSESVFVEAGSTKLAVVRIRGSDNSFSVFLLGIVGNELRRIACTRGYPDPIPITYGPCGEKVKEVFGEKIGG